MPKLPFYAYLHENGDVICKTAYVCENGTTPEEYFDSDFVVEWWKVEKLSDWKMVQDYAERYREDKKEGDPNPGVLKFSDLLKENKDDPIKPAD